MNALLEKLRTCLAVNVYAYDRVRINQPDCEREERAYARTAKRNLKNVTAERCFFFAVVIADERLGALVYTHHGHKHQLRKIRNNGINHHSVIPRNAQKHTVEEENTDSHGKLRHTIGNAEPRTAESFLQLSCIDFDEGKLRFCRKEMLHIYAEGHQL